MTSFFRKRIAEKIFWCVDMGRRTKDDIRKIAPLVKVSRFTEEHPKLILPINKVLEVMPTIKDNFSASNIILSLRNQGLPTAEGIIDIELSNELPQSFVFTIDKHVFNRIVLLDICVEFDNLTRNSCILSNLEKKKILIDFRSPVIGKTMRFSHLRTLFYCNFIGSICKYMQQNVNLLLSIEDWGPNCGLLLYGYSLFGIGEELDGNASNHMNEVLKASDVKYKDDLVFRDAVSDIMEKMEIDDPLVLSLHCKLQEAWIKDLISIFKRIGIRFTDIQYDSVFSKSIKSISNDLLAKEIISVNQGELKVNGPMTDQDELLTLQDNILGSELHALSRTVSSTITAKDYTDFDDMHFIDEKPQARFYKCVSKALEAMGYSWNKNVYHTYLRKLNLHHQEIKNSELACNLLERAKTIVLKELKMDLTLDLGPYEDDVAESLAQTAFIISDMRFRRNREYSPNFSEILSFREDSGIAYQFLHAGLVKMQEESKIKFKFDIDLSPLHEKIAVQLIQHLARFDEIVFKSYVYLEPAFLVQYIQTLCYLTRKAMNNLRLDIKEEKRGVIKARLLLFHATQKVLHESLCLLGIRPLVL